MNSYAMVSFWVGVVAVLGRLCYLAWADYPRTVEWTRGMDVLGLVASSGFLAWAAWLLWAR